MNLHRILRTRRLGAIAVAVAAATAALPAQALVIVPTYNANVSAAAKTAFQFAINEFQALYSDAVTVNINVEFGVTGLGQSSTSLQFVSPSTYAQVRTALINDQTAHPTANGAATVNAGGSINSTVDPTGGMVFLYTFAQAKALGARAANDAASDGTITFSNAQTFTFDANNRGTGGFDFIGVAEHEISEVLGRITLNGVNLTGSANAVPYDLFNFASAGTHTIGTGAGRYFSLDNGTTNLRGYNNAVLNGGDSQDWDSAFVISPYNASTGPNQAHSLSLATDLATLDVIGWDLVTAVPEPAQWALMLGGLVAVASVARRRQPR